MYEVESLCEEIIVILIIVDKEKDCVFVCLESGGGVVYGYGFVVF